MTDTDCMEVSFVPEVLPANNRRLKVGYVRRPPNPVHTPSIVMSGQWLETAGFTTGTMVEVKVMDGCIVLSAIKPEPEEPELLQSLRQVTTLSMTKQKQVQEFIGMIAGKRSRVRA